MAESRESVREAALRANGTYNRAAGEITDELFLKGGGFFDAHDLVQVKYEMLRRVREEGLTATRAAADFGFSRVSYYQILHAFERDGMSGLLPRPHGPRRAHKLTGEVMEFVRARLQAEPGKPEEEILALLREEFGLSVHIRSLQRALARRKKTADLPPGEKRIFTPGLRESARIGIERERRWRLGKTPFPEPRYGGVVVGAACGS